MSAPPNEPELTIEWIPAKQLSVIWVDAQRPFIRSHAKKILDNFDWSQFDPIKVTLPNGKGIYHIIDGQHRKEAIVMKFGEDQPSPCLIQNVRAPAEAAHRFDGINSRRRSVDPISKFKVRVTAGEKNECAILRIVENCGYKVGPLREGARNISAVNALIDVFAINGPVVLTNVLQIVSATWKEDPMATNGNLLRGYGAFLTEFGSKANWGHLKDSVAKKYTPGNLLAWAKQIQDNTGGSIIAAVSATLLSTYNRGLPPDKKLKKTGEA